MVAPWISTDPRLLVVSFAYVGVVIALGLGLRAAGGPPDLTRKLIHIGVGAWALPTALFFQAPLWAAALPLTFIVLNAISYRFRLMAVIEEEGRGSPGTIYFPLAFAVLVLLLWPQGQRAASVAGLYAMAFGDAAGSIFGRRWGKHQYRVPGGNKSWEGSAMMFLVSFGAILIGVYPLLGSWAWIPSLGAALVATVAEAPAGRGLDNLTVPFAGAGAFWVLSSLLG